MAESNFQKLAAKLAQRGNVSNPNALAAAIGRKKYGGLTMQKAARQGVSAQSIARKR